MFTFDDTLYSDLHKDACGFRPTRDDIYYSAPNEQKQKIWDSLCKEVDNQIENTSKEQAAAIIAFDKRIEEVMTLVIGSTRNDAIRFIIEADFDDNDITNIKADPAYACYHYGINYIEGTFEELNASNDPKVQAFFK